jgi:hypothetical protein
MVKIQNAINSDRTEDVIGMLRMFEAHGQVQDAHLMACSGFHLEGMAY